MDTNRLSKVTATLCGISLMPTDFPGHLYVDQAPPSAGEYGIVESTIWCITDPFCQDYFMAVIFDAMYTSKRKNGDWYIRALAIGRDWINAEAVTPRKAVMKCINTYVERYHGMEQ